MSRDEASQLREAVAAAEQACTPQRTRPQCRRLTRWPMQGPPLPRDTCPRHCAAPVRGVCGSSLSQALLVAKRAAADAAGAEAARSELLGAQEALSEAEGAAAAAGAARDGVATELAEARREAEEMRQDADIQDTSERGEGEGRRGRGRRGEEGEGVA